MDADGEVTSQHYAFLATEAEFDEIFARLGERRLPYWSDPRHRRRGHINHWDDGRGVYFADPNGHSLEVLPAPTPAREPKPGAPHPLAGD